MFKIAVAGLSTSLLDFFSITAKVFKLQGTTKAKAANHGLYIIITGLFKTEYMYAPLTGFFGFLKASWNRENKLELCRLLIRRVCRH